MNTPKISILGAGWLGLALHIDLLKSGYSVISSSRSTDKLAELKRKGLDVAYFDMENAESFDSPVLDADIFIICISGRFEELKGELYWDLKWQELFQVLKRKNPIKVLLMSSIGVIPNLNLAIDELLAEDVELVPSFSTCAERALRNYMPWSAHIFRLGGLIGPNRDLTRHFAGKLNLSNGLAPVNLIHLIDLLEIIKYAITNQIPNPVLHVVNTEHPTRMHFYTHICGVLKKDLPHFIEEIEDWKLVQSIYLPSFYNFRIDLNNLSLNQFKAFV